MGLYENIFVVDWTVKNFQRAFCFENCIPVCKNQAANVRNRIETKLTHNKTSIMSCEPADIP